MKFEQHKNIPKIHEQKGINSYPFPQCPQISQLYLVNFQVGRYKVIDCIQFKVIFLLN